MIHNLIMLIAMLSTFKCNFNLRVSWVSEFMNCPPLDKQLPSKVPSRVPVPFSPSQCEMDTKDLLPSWTSFTDDSTLSCWLTYFVLDCKRQHYLASLKHVELEEYQILALLVPYQRLIFWYLCHVVLLVKILFKNNLELFKRCRDVQCSSYSWYI